MLWFTLATYLNNWRVRLWNGNTALEGLPGVGKTSAIRRCRDIVDSQLKSVNKFKTIQFLFLEEPASLYESCVYRGETLNLFESVAENPCATWDSHQNYIIQLLLKRMVSLKRKISNHQRMGCPVVLQDGCARSQAHVSQIPIRNLRARK